MNLKQQREAALKAARDIAERVKAENRGFTDDEKSEVEGHMSKADELTEQIKAAEKSDELMAKVGALSNGDQTSGETGDAPAAKSLGEHFVKSVGQDGLARVKTHSGASISAPEFKAAGDTQSTPDSLAPWLTEYDRTIVRAFRRPVVSDILGSGSLSGNAVTYLVEGNIEGDFATVGEGGTKPPFHQTDPETRTDALKKIAGVLKFTDEMVEDAPFWVTEINNRGLYMLALAEEGQLLNGNGTGNNVLGLLNRDGVQNASASGADDNADAVFRAMTAVSTATGLSADGVVMNPADYEALRLRRDGNEQYYGGGYFQGQYGNGGVSDQPPIWGLRTIVTPAVAAGQAVVGAFNAASTVYRKGGVRVESTNSHADDFVNNVIRTRIEERVALAVRIPQAFVKVSLAGAAGGGDED